MSANNEVVIRRKQNGLYEIKDVDVEQGALNFLINDDVDGLDNAVNEANQYMCMRDDEDNPVEYGLEIINNL